MEKSITVKIDSRHYPVLFRGFDKPLNVTIQSGENICFLPWKFKNQMIALEQYLQPEGKTISLDQKGFAREVLRQSNIKDSFFDELEPLALWWAAAIDSKNHSENKNGWIQTGSIKVRLKPWSHKERIHAIEKSVIYGEGNSTLFNVTIYLEKMIAASVVATNPADIKLEELDAASAAALINSVIAANMANNNTEDEMPQTGNAELQPIAQTTLRLCRSLGWTPSQILNTPAPEINKLLTILNIVENDSPPSNLQSDQGLASHPDSIIIQVEED